MANVWLDPTHPVHEVIGTWYLVDATTSFVVGKIFKRTLHSEIVEAYAFTLRHDVIGEMKFIGEYNGVKSAMRAIEKVVLPE